MLTPQISQTTGHSPECSLHPGSPIEYYCANCIKYLCSECECLNGDHREKVVYYDERRGQLDKLCQDRIREREKQIALLDKGKLDDLKADVNAHFEELKSRGKTLVKKVSDAVNEILQQGEERKNNVIRDIEDHVKNISNRICDLSDEISKLSATAESIKLASDCGQIMAADNALKQVGNEATDIGKLDSKRKDILTSGQHFNDFESRLPQFEAGVKALCSACGKTFENLPRMTTGADKMVLYNLRQDMFSKQNVVMKKGEEGFKAPYQCGIGMDSDAVYIAGGFQVQFLTRTLASFSKVNLSTLNIESGPELKISRAQCGLALTHDYFVCVGGLSVGSNGPGYLSSIEMLKIADWPGGEWHVAAGTLPFPLYFPAVAVVGQEVYIYGGVVSGMGEARTLSDTIYIFSTVNEEVRTFPTKIPLALYSAALVCLEDEQTLLIIGGFKGFSAADESDRVYQVQVKTGKVTEAKPLKSPDTFYGSVATAEGKDVWVVGSSYLHIFREKVGCWETRQECDWYSL